MSKLRAWSMSFNMDVPYAMRDKKRIGYEHDTCSTALPAQ